MSPPARESYFMMMMTQVSGVFLPIGSGRSALTAARQNLNAEKTCARNTAFSTGENRTHGESWVFSAIVNTGPTRKNQTSPID